MAGYPETDWRARAKSAWLQPLLRIPHLIQLFGNILLSPALWPIFDREGNWLCPRKGTKMEADETAPIFRELKIPPSPDDRDTIIQSCYELLCSSRPLAEVLDEAKRLSDLSKRTKPDTTDEPCNAGVSDRPDTATSHRSTRDESAIAHVPEPMSSSIINQTRR